MGLTSFGRELRKLRIDRDERLMDMASRLGKSTSFISAIEAGRKTIPQDFEEIIINAYGLSGTDADLMRRSADLSRADFRIEARTPAAKDMAGLLARRINELPESDLNEIRAIIKGDRNK